MTTPSTAAARGDFREHLAHGGLALFDGAMGTRLYQRGAFINRPFEELNVTDPDTVSAVHAEYLAAGADILETNTFAANRFRLSPHGLEDRVAAINEAGVALARRAAEGRAWVAGAMGPLGVRIEPFGPISREEARDVFREQAAALVAAGVDLLCLETFGHLPELVIAIEAARSVTRLPVVAQLAMGSGGLSREGVRASDAARTLEAAGADVIGVNCSDALSTLAAVAAIRSATDLPISCQPNAGQAKSVEGRRLYLGSPDYFTAWGRRASRLGVRLLGGCCGTTPAHIQALRGVLSEATPRLEADAIARPKDRPARATPVPTARKSVLAAALSAGRFVTVVEVPPVRGWDLAQAQSMARDLALAGVTAMAIPEGPGSVAHLPPFVQAEVCRRVGMGTIIHYTARGRRLLRMQSDLLGAAASGVANLLLLTGDPLVPGAEPDDGPDLEVDAIGLVNLVTRLNSGEDVGGNAIGRPTEFFAGVHLDPTAFDPERERSRFFWKVDAGAEYAITAPVFSVEALTDCVATLPAGPDGRRVPIIATVWPLSTATQAELFEHRQSSSVPVPDAIVERMRLAEARGDEEAEGLAIAQELAVAVAPHVAGIQVVATQPGRVDRALEVLAKIR